MDGWMIDRLMCNYVASGCAPQIKMLLWCVDEPMVSSPSHDYLWLGLYKLG